MLRWWSLSYWRRFFALVRHREQLALLLWPFLSVSERTQDDAEPLRLLKRMVRAIENGHDDFLHDATAQQLWRQANTNEAVQQAAGALRTMRLQLAGDATAAGLQVAPVGRKQLKLLHDQMNADKLDNSFGSWIHAPLTLPLLSVLFLFSGWLFNSIFFRHFGLPVGRYFGLSDYLAASIEGLVPATVAVIFTFATQWLIRNRIRLQVLQNHLGSGWKNFGFTLLAFVIALPLVSKLISEPAVQRVMYIYLAVLALPIMAIPLLTSFSRRPARDTLLLNFAIIYLAVIWFTAEMRYINLLEKKRASSEVRLVNDPASALSWPVISGNSLYLFMLNEQQELVAVPVQQVLSVRYFPNDKADGENAAAPVTPTVATEPMAAPASPAQEKPVP